MDATGNASDSAMGTSIGTATGSAGGAPSSAVVRSPPRRATPLTLRAFRYWTYQYRRTWRGGVVSSVLQPVLFLAAMGLGLGSVIDQGGRGASLGGHGYLSFLAPGLLAASAMQTGVGESTYPVLGSIKWVKTYYCQLATPLRAVDVQRGHLLWMAVRITMSSGIFLVVMAVFGVLPGWSSLLALPAAVLTGMAFAAPFSAFSARCESDSAFAAINRFVVIPLFLFSGTFFPVDQLPALLRPIAWVTPLWHGVVLTRGLALGGIGGPSGVGAMVALVHVAVLAAFVVGGVVAGGRVYRRRLES